MPFTDPQGVPAATYRLQLRHEFPFPAAAQLVPYLHALGVSHCYCSPILMSTPGSTHGYDVNDYRRIDPELGGREAFATFARSVKEHGMGILLDFVPNHMGINGGRNAWWLDVLECGPLSPFGEFFDIDWHEPLPAGQGRPRVLVPILDNHYGVVLEQGWARGVFLPQVWEGLPEAEEFLRQLRRKAGLSPDGWGEDTNLWRFAVEKLRE